MPYQKSPIAAVKIQLFTVICTATESVNTVQLTVTNCHVGLTAGRLTTIAFVPKASNIRFLVSCKVDIKICNVSMKLRKPAAAASSYPKSNDPSCRDPWSLVEMCGRRSVRPFTSHSSRDETPTRDNGTGRQTPNASPPHSRSSALLNRTKYSRAMYIHNIGLQYCWGRLKILVRCKLAKLPNKKSVLLYSIFFSSSRLRVALIGGTKLDWCLLLANPFLS